MNNNVTPSPQEVDVVTADEVNSQESSSQDDPEEKLLQNLEEGNVEEEKKENGEPTQAPTLIRAAVASGSVPDASPGKNATANSEIQKVLDVQCVMHANHAAALYCFLNYFIQLICSYFPCLLQS